MITQERDEVLQSTGDQGDADAEVERGQIGFGDRRVFAQVDSQTDHEDDQWVAAPALKSEETDSIVRIGINSTDVCA